MVSLLRPPDFLLCGPLVRLALRPGAPLLRGDGGSRRRDPSRQRSQVLRSSRSESVRTAHRDGRDRASHRQDPLPAHQRLRGADEPNAARRVLPRVGKRDLVRARAESSGISSAGAHASGVIEGSAGDRRTAVVHRVPRGGRSGSGRSCVTATTVDRVSKNYRACTMGKNL